MSKKSYKDRMLEYLERYQSELEGDPYDYPEEEKMFDSGRLSALQDFRDYITSLRA